MDSLLALVDELDLSGNRNPRRRQGFPFGVEFYLRMLNKT